MLRHLKILLRHCLNGGGILGRRHAGYLLKLSGEVMDGRIAEGIGYLCEIHMLCPDQLFGKPDLHMGKIFYNAQPALLLKYFLELGSAYQIVAADLFDGELCGRLGFHIFDNAGIYLQIALGLGGFDAIRNCRDSRLPHRFITARKMDQELFQIQADQLFGAEGLLFLLGHVLQIRVI